MNHKNYYSFMIAGVLLYTLSFGFVWAQEEGAQPQPPVAKESVKGPRESWDGGSIMYDDKEVGWVNEAIKSFEQGIPLQILLPNIFPQSGVAKEDIIEEEEQKAEESVPTGEPLLETSVEVPVFYLNSILYFSPDNWTVWVNNKKISNQNQVSDKLDIVSVDSAKVVFLWHDTKLDAIYPKWKTSFYELDKGRFVSNNKNLVINLENEDVSFILGPNQSFVAKDMKIIEGTAEATQVNVQAGAGAPVDGLQGDGSGGLSGVIGGNTKPDVDNFLNGHNPAEGLESMQKYMIQLDALKSALDSSKR